MQQLLQVLIMAFIPYFRLGKNQLNGLKKLAAFCRNPLLVEHQQELLRSQCLQFWRIPDHSKVLKTNIRVDDIKKFIDKPGYLCY